MIVPLGLYVMFTGQFSTYKTGFAYTLCTS